MSLGKVFQSRQRGVQGFFVSDVAPVLIEIVGYYGFDFVVLDTEHGLVGSDLLHLMRTAHSVGLTTIVRVPPRGYRDVSLALDAGADGILVPGVKSADEVRQAISAAKYAPLGSRGVAFLTRAAQYELQSGPDFLARQNDRTIVLAQIETLEAVEALDAILAVEGLNGIFVGPGDLSTAMGYGGIYTPEVDALIQRVAQQADEHDMPWGLFTAGADQHQLWHQRGAYYCTTGIGNVLRSGLLEWMVGGSPIDGQGATSS